MTQSNEGGPVDIVVTIIVLLATLSLWIGSGWIFYNRTWPPFKVKQVQILTVSSIAGGIFITSTIIANNHYPRYVDSFWGNCTFWRLWMQGLLGYAPWISCMIIRCFRLYRVIIQLKQEKQYLFYLYLGILLIPFFIYVLLGDVYDSQVNNIEAGICEASGAGWLIGGFMIVAGYIILFLVTAFLVRNIRDEYNEYLIIRRGALINITLIIIDGLLRILKGSLDVSTATIILSRTISTLTPTIGVTYFFWASVAEPVYFSIKSKEDYTDNFIRRSRRISDRFVEEGVRKSKHIRKSDVTDSKTSVLNAASENSEEVEK